MDIEELKKEYEERFTDSLPLDKFNEWFDPLPQHRIAVNIWIWLEGKLKSTQIGKANQVDAVVIPKIAEFTLEEIEIMREWFNNVLDINPLHLKDYDIELAKKLYKKLDIRLPNELSNFSE